MFKFSEPEEEFKTDKSLNKNTKTKVNFLLTLLIILSFFLFLIQSDFVRIFENNSIEENCYSNNNFNYRSDSTDLEIVKIKKALNDNLKGISELKGYLGSEVKDNPDFNLSRKKAIYIYFKEKSEAQKEIPETLCGHKVVIEEK